MSRAASPSPVRSPLYHFPTSQPLAQSSSSTSTSTSTTTTPTPRAPLRINTSTTATSHSAHDLTHIPVAGAGDVRPGLRDRSFSNTSALYPYSHMQHQADSPIDGHGRSRSGSGLGQAYVGQDQGNSQGASPGGARDVALAVRGLRGELDSPIQEYPNGAKEGHCEGHSRNWSNGSINESGGRDVLVGPGTAGWGSPATTITSGTEIERVRPNGNLATTDEAMTTTPENAGDRLARLRDNAQASGSGSGSGPGHTRQFRGHVSAMSGGSTGSHDGQVPGMGSVTGSGSSSSHTLARIAKALERSSDEGDTLDLSRRGIVRIEDEDVEMFRSGVGKEKKGVWRLALSYNAFTDGAIAMSFSGLSRLRYLNLKGNQFTHFPIPLTDMPTLEILDLSKNQIEGFPDSPGSLHNLKVLSLTSNHIYTLPSYLKEFNNLKVFKVAQNPIEWPPPEVLGALIENEQTQAGGEGESSKLRKDEDLRPWIENMKSWMRQRAIESQQILDRGRQDQEMLGDESLASDLPVWDQPNPGLVSSGSSAVLMGPPSQKSSILPTTPISQRSFLDHRNVAATSSEDSLIQPTSPKSSTFSISRHNRNMSSSSYTPPLSAISSAHSRNSSMNMPPPPIPLTSTTSGHSRGASYTATQRLSGQLTAKKSLPDLRQSHAKIIQDRMGEPSPAEQTRPLGLGITGNSTSNRPDLPFKPIWTAEMARSASNNGPRSPEAARTRLLLRQGSAEALRRIKKDLSADVPSNKRNSREGPMIDESRNSYFRRLSTLPISTISKSIPPALLKFIDAIRGILFALSQVHSALRQYLVFAVNERTSSLLDRVMEPATTYMNSMINALDRFDSMSRRNSPPVQAIRGVIDSTKESVAVFAKVIAVLRLQIPALKANDVRYTRTLLLMIYGSMAEVARSWQAMGPLIAEVKPLVSGDVHGVAMRAVLGGHKMVPTTSLTGRTPISPIPERGESHSPPSVPRSSMSTITGGSPIPEGIEESPAPAKLHGVDGAGKTRRQAGSFSSHDVERGMLMGSPTTSTKPLDGPPKPGYIRHRPSESAPMLLEQMDESDVEKDEQEDGLIGVPPFPIKAISPNGTSSNVSITPPEAVPAQPVEMTPASSSQQGRPRHKPSSSSGSSHALSLSSGLPHQFRKLSVDVRPATPASATLFDEDLLDMIESATEIAFTVWLRLAEDVGSTSSLSLAHRKTDSQSSDNSILEPLSARSTHGRQPSYARPDTISSKHHHELLSLLSIAEQITSALRESLMGLRANPQSYPQTTLPDDAQSFIKTVIRVSALVKTISRTHIFPLHVRQAISRLTQATRECAILIQVSSLRPGNITPAPMSAFSNSGSRSASPFPFPKTGSGSAGIGGSSEDLTSGSGRSSAWASTSSLNLNAHVAGGGGNGSGSGSGSYSMNPPMSASAVQVNGSGSGSGWGGLRGLQLPGRMARGRAGTNGS